MHVVHLASPKRLEANYAKGRELLDATILLRQWFCSFLYVRIVYERRPSRFLSIGSLTDYVGDATLPRCTCLSERMWALSEYVPPHAQYATYDACNKLSVLVLYTRNLIVFASDSLSFHEQSGRYAKINLFLLRLIERLFVIKNIQSCNLHRRIR